MNFDLNWLSTYIVMINVDGPRPHTMTYAEFGCGCKVGIKPDGSAQLYADTAFCEHHRPRRHA